MEDCIDEKLATAFHDVPIPTGLAQRVLDRLAAARNEELAARNADAVVPRSSLFVVGLSRRWLVAGGGLLAVAAGLLLAVWLGGYRRESLNEQAVLDEAIRRLDEVFQAKGELVSDRPAPARFPISPAVVEVRGVRWRSLEGFLDSRGVVYQFPDVAGARAALFVVPAANWTGLDTGPAQYPSLTTGGCSASAWREGTLLYVLVVQGDAATYNGYLLGYREPVA